MEMEAPRPQSGRSPNAGGMASSVGPLRFAAAMSIVIAAALAANQIPTVDPYNPQAVGMWTWFWSPIEFNAAKRLPAIESDLNAIYAYPTTNDVWVVGDAGTFLHSPDSGSTWTQLKIRYPSAAKSSSLVAPSSMPASGSKWSIIPSAEAA